jgi:hypothetical protein
MGRVGSERSAARGDAAMVCPNCGANIDVESLGSAGSVRLQSERATRELSPSPRAKRRSDGRGVSLTRRSLVLVGVALLLFGGAAGFGLGFKVEQNRVKSAGKPAKATPKANAQTAARAAQVRLQKLRICLAGKGLHWPAIAGKFKTQVGTPPPGVTVAKYKQSLASCLISVAKGSRAPPTTAAAASTG